MNNINRTIRKIAIALTAIIALGVSVPLLAQGVATSDIHGTVTGITSSDYTMKVTEDRTGKTLTSSLAADGSYRFPALDPGNYTLSVLKAGASVSETPVKVTLGSNALADFDFGQTSSGLEEVLVTGTSVRLAVDVSSTDSGLLLGEFDVDSMPIARNTTAVALLAPGVVLGDTGFGNTASFGGASVAENACIINGLEVTNTRQGLGCGSVPFEFYKEFQIKTGGYSAEFGRSTGGLINAVTKSGGNEWEFTGAAYYSPDWLNAPGQVSRGDGNTGQVFRDQRNDDNNNSELIVTASGPIIKDTLFIYALINPRNTKQDYAWRIGSTLDGDTQFRNRTSKGGDNLFWGAKLDWQIVEGHEVSFFGYSDRNDSEVLTYDYNPETQVIGTESTGGFLRKRGGTAWSVTYKGYFTDNFYATALYGQIDTEYEDDPLNQDCPAIRDSRPGIPAELRASGCGPGGAVGDNNDSNKQARLDFNFDIGNHQLKAGFDYQKRDSTRITLPVAGHSYRYRTLDPNGVVQGDFGPLYTNETGAAQDYVDDRIFVGGGGFSSELTAFYIEDNWQVMDNLLLTIGLRKDDMNSTGTTGKLLTDYSTDIAPRLGFAWDIMGDGDSKLYGTFGTYYLPIANNTIYRSAAGISDSTTLYTFTGIDPTTGEPLGAVPINGTEANSSFTSSKDTIAEKDTFQAANSNPFSKDEYILGYSQVLNETMTFGVRGIYREVTSALDDYCGVYAYPYCIMVVPGEDNSWYSDGYYWDGSSLDADKLYLFDGVPDPGSLTTYPASTLMLPKGNNEYKALQFELSQVTDNMRWNFIYTWSKSTGNFEGAVKSDIDQADAGVTQDFDFPALMDGAQGYQPNDRRHVFKLFGSYNFTEAFSLGFNALLASGRPLSSFGQGYPDDDPNIYGSYGDTFYLYTGECPDTNGSGECDQSEKIYTFHPRGSAGRTAWTFNLDLSARYTWQFSRVELTAVAQVFNIFNIQEPTILNEHYESTEGQKNQFYGAAYDWQAPRRVTVGLEARF